jgi:hypothetical protein
MIADHHCAGLERELAKTNAELFALKHEMSRRFDNLESQMRGCLSSLKLSALEIVYCVALGIFVAVCVTIFFAVTK